MPKKKKEKKEKESEPRVPQLRGQELWGRWVGLCCCQQWAEVSSARVVYCFWLSGPVGVPSSLWGYEEASGVVSYYYWDWP